MEEAAPENRDGEVDRSGVLAAFPLFEPRVVSSFDSSTRNDLWLIEDAKSKQYVLTHHQQQPVGLFLPV